MVGYSADDYLRFSADKETIYYSEPVYACEDAYVLPTNDNSEQWGVRSDGHWTYVNCLMYSFPPQGWKIHITSTIYDAQNVLYDVAEYLFVKSISFKYLSNRTCFIQANGKYADRLESGKFITIYPSSEHIFIQLLKDLKTIVCKYDDGPYILTDKQWQNSNVFFRYGALKPRFSNEKNVPVIVTPQGDLIPDKELPLYSLPSFVDEPIYVKENNYFIEYSNGKLTDYQIDSAVHFSNNGGVYLASRNGKKYILKEGRKNVGVSDRSCLDAFHRIKHEYQILRSLSPLSDVVNAVDCFDVWNHAFLVEDFFEGRDLQQYIAMEFPFDGCSARTDCSDSYWRGCKEIATKLESAIAKMHGIGFAVGDLSLSNVLINDLCKLYEKLRGKKKRFFYFYIIVIATSIAFSALFVLSLWILSSQSLKYFGVLIIFHSLWLISLFLCHWDWLFMSRRRKLLIRDVNNMDKELKYLDTIKNSEGIGE